MKIQITGNESAEELSHLIRLLMVVRDRKREEEKKPVFDIDRFATSISIRSKLVLVKENIRKLEEVYGKNIPIDVLKHEVNISEKDFKEALDKLERQGDVFRPKEGYIQLVNDN